VLFLNKFQIKAFRFFSY